MKKKHVKYTLDNLRVAQEAHIVQLNIMKDPSVSFRKKKNPFEKKDELLQRRNGAKQQ